MKKFWIGVAILCLPISADAAAAQKFSRFSKNEIGPLQVVGVALSEDAASAPVCGQCSRESVDRIGTI